MSDYESLKADSEQEQLEAMLDEAELRAEQENDWPTQDGSF